jgi:tRNA-binding protein
VGEIVSAELLPNPQYSTHLLSINFGPEVGVKKSAARLINYDPKELIGQQVIGVVNFAPKQIGRVMSEVLTLGVPGNDKNCVLVQPETQAVIGGKLF